MNFQIVSNDKRKGVFPYRSLPSFYQFCKQSGLQTRWNAEEKTLSVQSGMMGKKIYLSPHHTETTDHSDSLQWEKELLTMIDTFLSNTGAEVIWQEEPPLSSEQEGLHIHISRLKEDADESPLTVFHDLNKKDKELLNLLKQELADCNMKISFKKQSSQHFSLTLLRIQLPSSLSHHEQEQIAIALVSAIIVHYQGNHPMAHLLALPLEALSPFIHQEQPPLQETIPESTPTPQNEPQRFPQADVFFDYMVLLPDHNDQPILIIGHLTIKNTGTEPLYHPIIYLRSSPADSVNIRGQILPANMTETLSVQTAEGEKKGWKYVDTDTSPGELWIQPIQQMVIQPQEMEAFQHFQIRISKSAVKETVTIQANVSFQEQNLTFPSHNRIVISF